MSNSQDLNNLIRDVSPQFDILIENSQSFLKLFGSLGTSFNFNTGTPLVTNTKYEWINENLVQYKSAITGFDTDGDGTGVNVGDTTGFEVGSIVRFESSLGASKTELAQVASVDSATDLTITRDYGATAGITLVVGDVAILNSTPKIEATNVGAAILQQGAPDFNFTEIFDEAASLSRTAQASATYDRASSMAKQVQAAMVRLARKLEAAAIYGVKVERTNSVPGTMGGILQFIEGAGGNIDASGGALSQSLVNNVIEDIIADGGPLGAPVLLMSPNQSRKLSALNTAGVNPTVFKDNTDRSIGNFTTKFVGDLPIDGGAIMAQVFVAHNMAKDKVAVLDMDKIDFRVMSGLTAKDATLPGADSTTERLLTELTLEIENATKAHGIITGLDL